MDNVEKIIKINRKREIWDGFHSTSNIIKYVVLFLFLVVLYPCVNGAFTQTDVIGDINECDYLKCGSFLGAIGY